MIKRSVYGLHRTTGSLVRQLASTLRNAVTLVLIVAKDVRLLLWGLIRHVVYTRAFCALCGHEFCPTAEVSLFSYRQRLPDYLSLPAFLIGQWHN